jgi:DNA-binding NtrC family response regulator
MNENAVESVSKIVLILNEKIRVLQVDDEPDLLKIAKQCLEIEGQLQVDTALSVDEAWARSGKEKYDAIVSDYQMPEKDGLEFLKKLGEKGNTIPFIMFTRKGREEAAIKALTQGDSQYLNKVG